MFKYVLLMLITTSLFSNGLVKKNKDYKVLKTLKLNNELYSKSYKKNIENLYDCVNKEIDNKYIMNILLKETGTNTNVFVTNMEILITKKEMIEIDDKMKKSKNGEEYNGYLVMFGSIYIDLVKQFDLKKDANDLIINNIVMSSMSQLEYSKNLDISNQLYILKRLEDYDNKSIYECLEK